jgi:hypothetical protein
MEGITYEITDAKARQQLQQIIAGLPTVDEQMRNAFTQVQNDISELQEDMETATKPRNLYGLQDGRAASANLPAQGTNSLQYLIGTSSMTTGKPPIGDCKILNMEWDNTGGWTSQLAIGHPANMTAANAMAIRRMSSGSWGDWYTLLNLLYPVGSVYISNTNTNPANILGGTWSLIHKRFAYQIVEDPVTFNTTNTQNGDSVAVINGEQIELRLSFAPKVELNDSSIAIGQLNLGQIGLSGKYGEYVPFLADGGNGIAIMNVSNTGAISTQDVITKTSGGTIPASTSAGQARVSLMFAQTSMLDSFCDEFHWKRTA